MTKSNTTSIFQRPVWVVVFALTAAIAWGWAYPLIKLGFQHWGIDQDMTGGKMLFAGIRFAISGLIILAIAGTTGKRFKVNNRWGVGVCDIIRTAQHLSALHLFLHRIVA